MSERDKILLRKQRNPPRNERREPLPVVPATTPAALEAGLVAFKTNLPKYVFYGGCVAFVAVILIWVFKVSTFGVFVYDKVTGTVSRVPITPSMQIPPQYTSVPISASDSTSFPDVLQTGYTVGFDVNIADGTPVQNSYRVIFYNGVQTRDMTVDASDDSQLNNTGEALSFIIPTTSAGSSTALPPSGIDSTTLTAIQTALFANSSNICLYMSPDTNDLYITYFVGHFTPGTTGSTGAMGSAVESLDGWAISKPIKNVPIGKPFRITLVVDGQFIETYINGELVLTTKTYISGQTSSLHSYNSSNNYNFYGSPDIIYLKGSRVANIQYWNQILPSKSVRVFSSNPLKAVNYS